MLLKFLYLGFGFHGLELRVHFEIRLTSYSVLISVFSYNFYKNAL